MNISSMIKGIQHIGIPTNNLEETTEFYKGLGFTEAFVTINEAANEKVAFLQKDNLVIETYENHAAAMKSGAIDHICLDVTDIEAAFICIKEEGYKLLDQEIQYLPFWNKGVRFFTILGPNNEKVEFCQKL